MFKFELLINIFQGKTFPFTDEASAVESLGKTPRLIQGEKILRLQRPMIWKLQKLALKKEGYGGHTYVLDKVLMFINSE